MGMTLTQKILAYYAGKESVCPGDLITCRPDVILGNDITTPVAVKEWNKAGFSTVDDPDRIVVVLDHFVPNKDVKAAEQSKTCRDFCRAQGVKNFFDVGSMGIEHALLPEQGLVTTGDLVIGADSHTCTYGALGAFATGIGSTDMAAAMAAGTAWFRVPSAIKVELRGSLPAYCSGKDVILTLIGKIGVDGALYKSLEFCGEGVKALSMDDRFCICNMAIEAGAKNGIFPVDELTLSYVEGRQKRQGKVFSADADAEYDETIVIHLSEIVQTVACPSLPENTRPAKELSDVRIDQVVIGSCTNGRLSDMKAAYDVLRGKKVADGVRCIVIPATMEVYKACLREGYTEAFIDAGCVVSTPTCGPCLGGYMGVLAEGERCVSTTNRNFVGRMGHVKSEVFLASPYTAAASAIKGYISEYGGEE